MSNVMKRQPNSRVSLMQNIMTVHGKPQRTGSDSAWTILHACRLGRRCGAWAGASVIDLRLRLLPGAAGQPNKPCAAATKGILLTPRRRAAFGRIAAAAA